MRRNPAGDWTIKDIQRLCEWLGWEYLPPSGGGSLGQWRQRVPRSLHEKLKFVAAREGVSLNAYVANVLAETVGRAA